MFLSLTLGSVASAALPLPGVGSTAPVAAQAPKRLYIWAVAMARAGNPISQSTLSQALKVSPDQASALIGRLVSRGVVTAPNAAGVAHAVKPMLRTLSQTTVLAPTAAPPAPPSAPPVRKVLDRVQAVLEEDGAPDLDNVTPVNEGASDREAPARLGHAKSGPLKGSRGCE